MHTTTTRTATTMVLPSTSSTRLKLLIVTIFSFFVSSALGTNGKQGVTYDGRSLIVNGKRELLFSGSIHYPRSTPDVCNL